MLPKAHLFVVDNDTMPIHIQRGFCGIVSIGRLNKSGGLNGSYFGQIADLMNISLGDLVYFYMMKKSAFFRIAAGHSYAPLQQGYYGVFQVTGLPFVCGDQISGEYPFEEFRIFGSRDNRDYREMDRRHYVASKGKHLPILSHRIPIEPIPDYEKYFQNRVVDDNHAYVDRTDEGQLNTLLFKKIKRIGEERSITPILPEEASKISRLIFKAEKHDFPLFNAPQKAGRCGEGEALVRIDLVVKEDELARENMLEAYIAHALNTGAPLGDLQAAIGSYEEIEYCGNQVQYGISGNKVDMLLLHRRVIGGSISYRYKATVIELKKAKIDESSIRQIVDYQKWIAQLVTYNNISAIQPILVGKKPSARMAQEKKREIAQLLDRIVQSAVQPPVFIEYIPSQDKTIQFVKYDIRNYL